MRNAESRKPYWRSSTNTRGIEHWRAGCGESRMPGSVGVAGKGFAHTDTSPAAYPADTGARIDSDGEGREMRDAATVLEIIRACHEGIHYSGSASRQTR